MEICLIACALFFCMSCNRTLFVHKKDIIRNQKGYIVFYYKGEEAIFFSYKDTIDTKFLSKDHLDGYRINNGEKGLEYLKELALDDSVTQNVLQNGQSIQVTELVKLIPVNVQYYWGDKIKLKLQKKIVNNVTIRYEYASKEVEFLYRVYDHRYIMSITPTRKSDQIRVIPVPPTDRKH